MKRFLVVALAASMGLFIAGSASAATSTFEGDYGAGAAANGIVQSRHNLGAFGKHIITGSTTEICVFCHTPHHTNTATAPLWNRSVPSGASFSAYGTTIGGTNNSSVGGISLACLSCHDGATTFDNIVNAPGKDGVVVGGSDRGWLFTEDGSSKSDFMTSKRLNIGNLGTGGYNGTTAGLSDDHPMSVDYNGRDTVDAGGPRASLRAKTTVISGIDLAAGLTTTDDTITSNLWDVKGFISNTAVIGDLLRSGKVECTSCHDPHFKNASDPSIDGANDPLYTGEEIDGLFLRRVGGNSGSGVCRTCHEK